MKLRILRQDVKLVGFGERAHAKKETREESGY